VEVALMARAAYREVGIALRTSAAAVLADATLTRADIKVFLAVVALVASYSRLVDRYQIIDIARFAGVDETTARRSLKKLGARGHIVWNPKRGHGTRSETGLPAPGMNPGRNDPLSGEESGSPDADKPGLHARDNRGEAREDTGREGPESLSEEEQQREQLVDLVRRCLVDLTGASERAEATQLDNASDRIAGFLIEDGIVWEVEDDAGPITPGVPLSLVRDEIANRVNCLRHGFRDGVVTPKVVADFWDRALNVEHGYGMYQGAPA
jgi:hypothetical protein